ncbi:MAG: septum formation initiator family protein [Hyphomicrobiaceae bacterium]|nr:septum formation initiator family protein [Hyphomicrobiaceae bacterium]
MTVLRKKPKHDRPARVKQILVVLTCFAMTFTFAYHAMYGRHGFETRSRLISRSEGLEFEIRGLEAVRARLARDVALLAPEIPDADLVEGVARDVLGFVRPDEHVFAVDEPVL